jgi:hypothetical protein
MAKVTAAVAEAMIVPEAATDLLPVRTLSPPTATRAVPITKAAPTAHSAAVRIRQLQSDLSAAKIVNSNQINRTRNPKFRVTIKSCDPMTIRHAISQPGKQQQQH